MSWSINLVGRDKEKLKAAVRSEQCKDEAGNPHSGVPKRIADHLCAEIDRVRIYEFNGKTFGLTITGSGSWHEQGSNETLQMHATQIVE